MKPFVELWKEHYVTISIVVMWLATMITCLTMDLIRTIRIGLMNHAEKTKNLSGM